MMVTKTTTVEPVEDVEGMRAQLEELERELHAYRQTAGRMAHRTRPLAHERLEVAFGEAEQELDAALAEVRARAGTMNVLGAGDLNALAAAFVKARMPELRELAHAAVDRPARDGEFGDEVTFGGVEDYAERLEGMQREIARLEAAIELADAEAMAAAARLRADELAGKAA